MWPVSASAGMLACCCVSVFLAAVSAQSDYRKVGADVVLKPVSVSGTITDIAWRHNGNLAMELDAKGIDSFRHFKDRGSLNITTGEMKITGLIYSDSGEYTVEINNVLTTTINLKVISAVPVPTVSQSCDDDTTICTLTCDGNTTGAEPVTYTWKSDDTVTSSGKQLLIKEDSPTIGGVKEFHCVLKNPVSVNGSKPITNPFFIHPEPPGDGEPLHPKLIAGLTVFFCLLVPVLLLAFIHRCKAGMWFYEKDSMPWEKDFWRKSERKSKSTAANQEKKQTEEETSMT